MSSQQQQWQRAVLLAQQGRTELAIEALLQFLGGAPEFAPAHALLAQLHVERGDGAAARDAAARAIALAPDLPMAHAALAQVLYTSDDLDGAIAAIERAIALEPDAAEHHAVHSQLLLARKRWAEALAAADRGLVHDGAHTACLNLRSMALVKLGRGDEASDALDASLRRDPENPYTHQARGYALLHRGDAAGALRHFQEALRRDPTLDGSRAGLVEALKARSPVYRLLLSWVLFLDRYSAGRQQQILIGAWLVQFLGNRMLRSAGLDDYAYVLSLLWFGAVLFTICTVPLFNLLLLLHPIGRHALERRARNDALLFGAGIVAFAAVAVHAWLGVAVWSVLGWQFWLYLLIPIGGLGVFAPGWARRVLQVFVLAAIAWFVAWALRLEAAIATPEVQAALAAGELPDAVERVRDEIFTLRLAVVLSSWFVLLAPKGRRRR